MAVGYNSRKQERKEVVLVERRSNGLSIIIIYTSA